MGTPYVGEIRMFGGNFAPVSYAMCSGQTIQISENDTLFALIGTTYGGDGQATFQLPNLCGRFPVHMGQGPGISQNYIIGEAAGVEQVTLNTTQMPSHTHVPIGSTVGNSDSPNGTLWGASTSGNPYANGPGTANMNSADISPAGGSQPHENMIPFVVVTYIIALYGVYPSPN